MKMLAKNASDKLKMHQKTFGITNFQSASLRSGGAGVSHLNDSYFWEFQASRLKWLVLTIS